MDREPLLNPFKKARWSSFDRTGSHKSFGRRKRGWKSTNRKRRRLPESADLFFIPLREDLDYMEDYPRIKSRFIQQILSANKTDLSTDRWKAQVKWRRRQSDPGLQIETDTRKMECCEKRSIGQKLICFYRWKRVGQQPGQFHGWADIPCKCFGRAAFPWNRIRSKYFLGRKFYIQKHIKPMMRKLQLPGKAPAFGRKSQTFDDLYAVYSEFIDPYQKPWEVGRRGLFRRGKSASDVDCTGYYHRMGRMKAESPLLLCWYSEPCPRHICRAGSRFAGRRSRPFWQRPKQRYNTWEDFLYLLSHFASLLLWSCMPRHRIFL